MFWFTKRYIGYLEDILVIGDIFWMNRDIFWLIRDIFVSRGIFCFTMRYLDYQKDNLVNIDIFGLTKRYSG